MFKKLVNLFWLGIIFIFLYYIPYIIFGENSFITIWDYLNIEVAYTKIIIDSDAIFEQKTLPIMEGISGKMQLDIKNLFFLIFPTFIAIVINDLLVRICAYVGMFLLLKTFVLQKSKHNNLISFIASVCFAFIPFYSSLMLSSAGIPLLIYAMLNLKENRKIVVSYCIVTFFAFYSSFVLSGIFLCFTLFLYYLYIVVSNKKLYFNYLMALSLISLLYILTNLDLFVSFFIDDTYVSHRVEFQSNAIYMGIFKQSIKFFFVTQLHTGTLVTIPILLSVVIAFIYNKDIIKGKIFRICAFLILSISLIYFTFHISKIIFSQNWLLNAFGFDRFFFFQPTLWIIILAITFSFLAEQKKMLLIYGITIALLFINFCNNGEYRELGKRLIGLTFLDPAQPSFKQYYDTSLFDDIADSLNIQSREKCKVISVALDAAVSQYNGFHTLDAYLVDYPLAYKHKFRKIIQKELEKNEDIRKTFDHWGSVCYIFSSEIPPYHNFKKESHIKINNLEIDISVLKEMGCSYIFSSLEISNYSSLELSYKGCFTNEDSYWNIYVYALGSDSQINLILL